MSILVQCPNPACARTHKVKNRYAGKRCHCPDCNIVLKVPGARTLPPPAGPTTPVPMIRDDDFPAGIDLGTRTPAPISHANDAETVDLDELSVSEAPTAPPPSNRNENLEIADFSSADVLEEAIPATDPPLSGKRRRSEPAEVEEEFVDLLEADVVEDDEVPVATTKPAKRKRIEPEELEEVDESAEGEFEHKSKRGSKWLWAIIGVVVVALGAGAAVYFEPWK